MQIITVSKGSHSYGDNFARTLASKLDYQCIGRDEILEEATRQKIPIGKLETAIIKPHIFSEDLALELEHFKALATSILCKKALNHNIIYHGRTGHLLLPGIEHILKIRVIADLESRIDFVMQKLDLTREKAKLYIEQLDQDRKKWVKQFYNVDWDTSSFYDIVVNLSHLNVENAATAVCAMAQLPEFQTTPANTKSLQNLYLSSSARLLLAMDKRTSHLNIKVRSTDNVVNVTYLPQQVKDAKLITEVLAGLEDAQEIICTEAETNILWIQEAFKPDDSSYKDVLNLACMWDAAVELIQLTPSEVSEQLTSYYEKNEIKTDTWQESGIIDDDVENADKGSKGLSKVYEKLINDGVAGGKKIVQGSQKTLLNTIDRAIPYRLIILDNIFALKGHATQIRMQREWANFISDNLKVPVVSLDELHAKYSFGIKEGLQMTLSALFVIIVVYLTFQFNDEILSFLTKEGLTWKILASMCVFVFVPVFAYLYSTVTKLFLRMIKFE
jgi:cytidylate kinase